MTRLTTVAIAVSASLGLAVGCGDKDREPYDYEAEAKKEREAYKAKARLVARCFGVINITTSKVSTSRWTGFIRFSVTDRRLL